MPGGDANNDPIQIANFDVVAEEESKKDLFEFVFGDTNGSINSNADNLSGYHAPFLRRSRSASNITVDAKSIFGELLNFDEEDEYVDEDPFEPLPITSSFNINDIDLNVFENLNPELSNHHELNNQKKKRGRRRSLLRRSNSFESLFDKKKVLKKLDGGLPSSKRQPSFIHSHNSSVDPFVSSPYNTSAAVNYVPEFEPIASYDDVNVSEIAVSTYQGMDIVLQGDCKTLNTKPTIVGNNRLRILLYLERGRFLMLSPAEQQKTVSNLMRTITEKWKGRVLVENGLSYNALSHNDATDAIHSLLLGGKNGSNGKSQNVADASMPRASSSLSTIESSPKSSSLLAAAPPLPDFLVNASKAILNSCKQKYLTESERQAAAINALKERHKTRQLLKQKAKNTD